MRLATEQARGQLPDQTASSSPAAVPTSRASVRLLAAAKQAASQLSHKTARSTAVV
jgi:hypothetical protein